MEDRGDSDDLIAQTAIEFLDPRIVNYIERHARGEVDAHFRITSKQDLTGAESIDDSARFSKTCTNPQDKERDSELWDRYCARRQKGKSPPVDLMDAIDEMTAAILAEGERGTAT